MNRLKSLVAAAAAGVPLVYVNRQPINLDTLPDNQAFVASNEVDSGTPGTIALWVGPFVLMGAGGIVRLGFLRRRNRALGRDELSEDETRRAQALLREGER